MMNINVKVNVKVAKWYIFKKGEKKNSNLGIFWNKIL